MRLRLAGPVAMAAGQVPLLLGLLILLVELWGLDGASAAGCLVAVASFVAGAVGGAIRLFDASEPRSP